MRKVRGNKITMIFQEPMTSLNPLHTVERQIGEILKIHQGMGEQRPASAPWNCSSRSASGMRKNGSAPSLTSFPAGSASAS